MLKIAVLIGSVINNYRNTDKLQAMKESFDNAIKHMELAVLKMDAFCKECSKERTSIERDIMNRLIRIEVEAERERNS